jgi:cytochrome c553
MRHWLVLAMVCSLGDLGCGNDHAPAPPDGGMTMTEDRALLCPNARSTDTIPQRLDATAPIATLTFEELRSALNSACSSCHLKPAANGGFSYTDDYASLSGAASKMATALVSKTMPPANIRDTDPAGYLKLGSRMRAWVDAGKPETAAFPLPEETIATGQQLPPAIAAAMTDIGDCIPVPEVVGHDAQLDAFFAAATALPATLNETDLVSLDAFVLAKRGTVGYNVEYPLWADNARKGRWIHVPAVVDAQGVATRKAITVDATTGQFQIPDNTRFYKTFFKQVTETDGIVRYRKVETRLIVVRHAPNKPLFGTYVWDAGEQGATLSTAPYRDGTPFKDQVLQLETDATMHTHRTYAVPGATRCNDCHQGSQSDSFVLGFTPIQLNRRAMGEAGRDAPTTADELAQLTRLASYGVVTGLAPDTAPKLEASGGTREARNIHELRFQAYATGNCGHCHNPKGYAKAKGVNLTLAPGGDIFQLTPGTVSQLGGIGSAILVIAGDPANSTLYEHVILPTHIDSSSAVLHMPMHTPGVDCNLLNRVGKWITSIPKTNGTKPTAFEIAAALTAADNFNAACPNDPDITWHDQDFTEPVVYAPRRADWNDPVNGMPQAIRDLQLSDGLLALSDSLIPNGYWGNPKVNGVPQCKFPDAPAPAGGASPWMLDATGQPKRPFGELYYEKPGAYFFGQVCAKCHGPHANGDSSLARAIAEETGGATRVANLHDGLFAGDHMSLLDGADADGSPRNFGGNYLIWMASGGTKVTFPPDPALSELIGPERGNMLQLVRVLCARLLPDSQFATVSTALSYDIVYKACTFDNPITPELGYALNGTTPLRPELQAAWINRAAQNVGWLVFRFLQVDGRANNWPISNSDCRLIYPAN